MTDSRDPIDRLLGYSRSKSFKSLEDSKSKRIIEAVLKNISKMFPNLSWNGLKVEHSNAGIDELQKNIEQLDLESLKIALDLEGFNGVPDEWIEFAEFLAKAQRGNQYYCNNYLGDLARIIIFKISGFSNDKDFVRTFYKAPINQVIRFFKKFRVTKISES